ncbi:MAG: TonB-dependent receptor, partial [Deltaproteobacteria bacterium]|nr:TonB-dependent receptor [Deltaproteobacteria bacterium]
PKLGLRIRSFLLAALLSAPANAAGAADLTELNLESLMNVTVSGASRYEQKSSEAPTYASIVTAEDIRRNGYRTLADLLRTLPGIYTSNDRNSIYVGFRGFLISKNFNSRVLLLVDGHRINNGVYDHAMIGNDFPVDLDLVERVEVVRGPSSSLYGSNAFFGVINVITKQARDIDGAEVSGSMGSWRTFQGRATLGKEYAEGPMLLVSGTASDSHGQDLYFPEFDDPATNNGVAEDDDGEKFNSQFAKVSWGGFTLEGVRGHWKKQIPTASFFSSFDDGRNHTVTESSYVDLRYEKDLPGGVNVLARTYFDYFNFDGTLANFVGVNRNIGDGRSCGVELKTVTKVGDRHRLTAGAEYRDDYREDQKNYYVGVSPPLLDSRQSSKSWAAYLQDEFRIHPKLILNAGVRYDHYSSFGGTTNPRLGLIWLPLETTTAKLLYGRAFRAPNAYELHFGNVGWMKPNPDLRPETIHSYEAVLEQGAEALGADWKFTAAAYHNDIEQLITLQTDPADGRFFFGNNESIHSSGVELEMAGKAANGIEGRASYAWQRATYRETGATVPNSPKDMVKLNLVLPLVAGRLYLSPEAQYVGPRKSLPTKTLESVGGYTVANATLLAPKLIGELELSASVYNIFDKSYADPAGSEHRQESIPQDGRSYRLKATCRF